MQIETHDPRHCSQEVISVFCKLLQSGGQVSLIGIEKRVRQSECIALAYIATDIAGIGAIKNPNPAYKKKVFSMANSSDKSDTYEIEVGYLVTAEKYRGRGISQALLSRLIKRSSSTSFFATTKNDSMRHVLSKIGFKQCGSSYKNSKNEKLDLYTFEKIVLA